MDEWIAPGGPGVRVETHLYPGYRIPPNYDSLVAKLLTHGATRDEAISRMCAALAETLVKGIETTIPLHQQLMREPGFVRGGFDIHHLERLLAAPHFPSAQAK